MRAWESRRRAVFAAALTALAAGAVLFSLLDPGEHVDEHPRRDVGARQGVLHPSARGAPSGGELAARSFLARLQLKAAERSRRGENESYAAPGAAEAAAVAERFVRAYLRYEVGALTRTDRDALRRSATPRLADELLGAPVRIPPGMRPPAERFVGLGAIRPAAVGGAAGLSAAALTRQNGRPQILGLSIVGRGGRWAVAGIGR
jgi:hypothetical protein